MTSFSSPMPRLLMARSMTAGDALPARLFHAAGQPSVGVNSGPPIFAKPRDFRTSLLVARF